MDPVYLDNNATTRVDPRVLETMLPFFTEQYGNPSSMHAFGDRVGHALERAREQVAALVGAAHASEIVFTSGGTEADSTALWSALRAQPDRREIITTAVEHPAVLNVCEQLEKEGYRIHRLGVDGRGRLDTRAYEDLLSERAGQVALVSVMWANNEAGTLFPVETMAEQARAAGVMFHTDAVQAVGKCPVDLKATAIDLLSLSGHKLHAPKGVGALYVRRGLRFRPLLRGGHQERGRRAGTENVPGIVGLGRAAELAQTHRSGEQGRVRALRDRLEQGLLAQIPHAFPTGDPENRLPNTLNMAFEYIEGESILLMLNREGIAASSGSACTSGSLEPSHVLRAMDIPYTAAHGAVRFSLSRFTTEAEIDRVIAVLPGIVERLRQLSPYWGETGPVTEPERAFAPAF
ncbi:MAG: cysteine desulfurase NifS [Ectothiorhodospira sp.]